MSLVLKCVTCLNFECSYGIRKILSDIQSFHCIRMLIGELKVSFSIALHAHQQGSLIYLFIFLTFLFFIYFFYIYFFNFWLC